MSVVRAIEADSLSVVAVTEDPGEFRRLKTRLGNRPSIQVALGLHPLRAASFTPYDMSRFFRLLPQAHWIGEVGLDYSKAGVATVRQQKRVFDAVLTEAQPGSHPLTVHSRGAEADVIQRLAEANLPAILHWYTGPLGLLDSALAAGLYFSINPAMVRSKKFAALLRIVPPSRILLESDGPYAKVQGRPTRPDDLKGVVTHLAATWGLPRDGAWSKITANQTRLLNEIKSS